MNWFRNFKPVEAQDALALYREVMELAGRSEIQMVPFVHDVDGQAVEDRWLAISARKRAHRLAKKSQEESHD